MRFDLLFFTIGATIGIFLMYFFSSKPKIVVKHPLVDENNQTVFKDDDGVCYKYGKKEVSCENFGQNLSNVPLVE